MDRVQTEGKLVECVANDGYSASLEVGQIYTMLVNGEPDLGLIRIIDESGDDYLFPEEFFRPARRYRRPVPSARFVVARRLFDVFRNRTRV